MSNVEIITIVLGSTVLSTILSAVLKVLLENRQNYKHQKNLVSYKSKYLLDEERERVKLLNKSELQKEQLRIKISYYKKLASLVYKVRNVSSGLMAKSISGAEVNNYSMMVDELSDLLYLMRLDLENDKIFYIIHSYKNYAKNFNELLWNMYERTDGNERGSSDTYSSEVRKCYDIIDDYYSQITTKLSRHVDLESIYE